jgi:hypothetical protein
LEQAWTTASDEMALLEMVQDEAKCLLSGTARVELGGGRQTRASDCCEIVAPKSSHWEDDHWDGESLKTWWGFVEAEEDFRRCGAEPKRVLEVAAEGLFLECLRRSTNGYLCHCNPDNPRS